MKLSFTKHLLSTYQVPNIETLTHLLTRIKTVGYRHSLHAPVPCQAHHSLLWVSKTKSVEQNKVLDLPGK